MTNKHTELPWDSNTLLSEHDYKWAAHCVNYHDRLREALKHVLNAKCPEDYWDARDLLTELNNLENEHE